MKRDALYLLDILGAARLAIGYLEGSSLAEFMGDSLLQDAFIRRIEIIGEAAIRVSEETRNQYVDLPWRDIFNDGQEARNAARQVAVRDCAVKCALHAGGWEPGHQRFSARIEPGNGERIGLGTKKQGKTGDSSPQSR